MFTITNPKNIILNCDSYKASHFLQLPPDTHKVSAYVESRGGMFAETVAFGLQMFYEEYLSKPITLADIAEAEYVFTAHGEPFNKEGWMHILKKCGGYLPLEIHSIKEGTVVPTHNVLATVTNTDVKVPWLTTYIETPFLRALWYPATVATLSFHIRRIIKKYMEKTCDTLDGLDFKLHDFGSRGRVYMPRNCVNCWKLLRV